MNKKHYPKSDKLPTYPQQANSGSFCSSETRPGFHPARGFLICLGWLRLYQTILSSRCRTRHVKLLRH
ncbi:MAG: hypothetical protein QOJ40_2115 [Verrucomicrobiota bacterium]